MPYRDWELWHDKNKRDKVIQIWNDTNDEAYIRRLAFYKVLNNTLSKVKPKTVLDFGCGSCKDYIYFKDKKHIKYTGCDITNEMLGIAKELFGGIDLFQDDILNSKIKDRAYDMVVSNAVIQHIPRMYSKRAIRTLIRIAKKCVVMRFFGMRQTNTEIKTINDFIHIFFSYNELNNIIKNILRQTNHTYQIIKENKNIPVLQDIAYLIINKK